MALSNFVNLDLTAQKYVLVREQDILFPKEITFKKWNFDMPTIASSKFQDSRKILVKIGDREVELKDQSIIKFLDASTKAELGHYEVTESFRGPRVVITNEIINTLIGLYPWLEKIDFHHLMIAGGAIATIIQHLSSDLPITSADINDIDFFLYGMDSASALTKIESLISTIKTCYPDATLIRTPCALTLIDKAGINKFQIVMSLFDSCSHILHTFDLGSTKAGLVFHDNTFKVMTTRLGLFCLEHRINVVDHHIDSSSYPQRLIKYFNRGYSIVLPDLDLNIVKQHHESSTTPLMLPQLIVKIISISGNQIKGTISMVNQKLPKKEKEEKEEKEYSYDGSLNYEELLKQPMDMEVKEVSYDGGFNYKTLKSSNYFDPSEYVCRFMKGDKLIVTKVDADDFTTGSDALAKTSLIPKVSIGSFRKYIPSIYTNDTLDLKVFGEIQDFDYNVFMKCRSKGDAYVQSYLYAIYYGVKAQEYFDAFLKSFQFPELQQYTESNILFKFRNISMNRETWYGPFLKK